MVWLLMAIPLAAGVVFSVTSTADSGVGTLRDAIVQANLAYVPETVETRKRDLPVISSVTVKPVVSPMFIGITGTMF